MGEVSKDFLPVILAGGFGTRIQHLVKDIPKPMVDVMGKPFVEWLCHYLKKQGFRDAVLATGHLSEVIEKHFEKNPVEGFQVTISQEEEPLGTGGAFLKAIRENREAGYYVLMNGDSILTLDLREVVEAFQKSGDKALIVGTRVEDAGRFGTCEIDDKGYLVGFKEKRNIQEPGIINAGIYMFQKEILKPFFEKKKLSMEYDIIPYLLEEGVRVKVHVGKGDFIDIGTPETLSLVGAFFEKCFSKVICS